jgi:hypothetical protein
MNLFKKKRAFTKHLEIAPPPAKESRHGIAIVSCIKNEEDYVAEWVRFHRAVGIRHFYLYDDGSTDRTRAIIEGLNGGDITLMPWMNRIVDMSTNGMLNSQTIAFAHAITNYGGDYRWMAFIDADEFLLPKTGRTVEEALAGAGGFPNISLPWHMFGTSGHKTKPAGPLLKNFTRRGAKPISDRKNISNFKCIVDPCEVSEVSVHLFGTRSFGEMTANDRGIRATLKERKLPGFYSAQFLQLNHYYSKSEEQLKAKLDRGPASPASRKAYVERVLTAVANIEAETVEDRAMADFIDRNGITGLLEA